ncbi:predicted protein [Aspergillus terreus NIH2624]|uniref:Tat pathway signal sequence n=1 Tax=Aspergillus terreus (strain NIH 2624 / FGSC A1156) TaxID=341663 RepID=Q0CVM8_ASPTN|nr:uncharacterized protein ATEG_02256 [Aspergillus terreus NIH2624]EAU37218.1 predicted protein [Aspergillus terreus NIH2624]
MQMATDGREESKYALLNSDSEERFQNPYARHRRYFRLSECAFVTANLVLFVVSLVTLLRAGSVTESRPMTANAIFKDVNAYSPILARLELPLHNYTVDGHLFDVTHNLLRQEPNPESNAEWDRIAQLGPMVMSREEVIKMNKDPEKVVKLPEDWGYGDDAYIWQTEMQHNIHCLNFVRQYAYFDHFYGKKYKRFEDTPKLDRIHLSHCLYVLVQDLRCQPSYNALTFNWMDGWHTPATDFTPERQCIFHEQWLQWQNENRVNYTDKRLPRPTDPRHISHGPPGMEQLWEDEL